MCDYLDLLRKPAAVRDDQPSEPVRSSTPPSRTAAPSWRGGHWLIPSTPPLPSQLRPTLAVSDHDREFLLYFFSITVCIIHMLIALQCFVTVGSVTGRASSLQQFLLCPKNGTRYWSKKVVICWIVLYIFNICTACPCGMYASLLYVHCFQHCFLHCCLSSSSDSLIILMELFICTEGNSRDQKYEYRSCLFPTFVVMCNILICSCDIDTSVNNVVLSYIARFRCFTD